MTMLRRAAPAGRPPAPAGRARGVTDADLPPPARSAPSRIARGSAAFWRVTAALFLAGFSTFSLLYCVQPLLPLFSSRFGIPPASSALSLSSATLSLAISILLAGCLSERFGRKPLIVASLFSAAVLNLLAAAAPGWHGLLLIRLIEGLALGGTPAVAMAYVSEEVEPRGLGLVMGLYIGGNALGGMCGRLITGLIAQTAGWRLAMGSIGVLSILAAAGFILLLPPSRHFSGVASLNPRFHLNAWRNHLRHPRLRLLFAIGFLVMGAFVSVYNFTGYRLERPPFGYGQGAIGAIFLVYTFGVAASAWAGTLGDRFGRAQVMTASMLIVLLGGLVTLAADLAAIVVGIACVTIGFFGVHSCASATVGRLAQQQKGHAASLYLLFYYLGSSVMGSVGGMFWSRWAWPGVVGFATASVLAALALAAHLARTAPPLVRA